MPLHKYGVIVPYKVYSDVRFVDILILSGC